MYLNPQPKSQFQILQGLTVTWDVFKLGKFALAGNMYPD